MNVQPTPLPKHLDARQRAARTFMAGLVSTILAAVGTALVAALGGGIRWTREYWYAVAASVGIAAVSALVSYVMRFWTPPTN